MQYTAVKRVDSRDKIKFLSDSYAKTRFRLFIHELRLNSKDLG